MPLVSRRRTFLFHSVFHFVILQQLKLLIFPQVDIGRLSADTEKAKEEKETKK